MLLPKYFRRETPFSRYLTITLFLLLPFMAFFLGIKYQVMVTPSYPPTQYIPPPQMQIVSHPQHFLEITVTPEISCKPRPACLDAKPKCLIAETPDMCPPAPAMQGN